jgi:hypothetical protein
MSAFMRFLSGFQPLNKLFCCHDYLQAIENAQVGNRQSKFIMLQNTILDTPTDNVVFHANELWGGGKVIDGKFT